MHYSASSSRAASRPSTAHRLCATALLICVSVPFGLALAAGSAAPDDIEARYRSERAACESGQSAQDRATCLREAAAARDAARKGQLDDSKEAYERNALARCDAVPPADREACRRRARGEGEVSGSVGGGGILREYREITLPPAKPQDEAAPGKPQDIQNPNRK